MEEEDNYEKGLDDMQRMEEEDSTNEKGLNNEEFILEEEVEEYFSDQKELDATSSNFLRESENAIILESTYDPEFPFINSDDNSGPMGRGGKWEKNEQNVIVGEINAYLGVNDQYELKDVAHDGNCFFTALHLADSSRIPEISVQRKKVSSEMKENDFQNFLAERDEQYTYESDDIIDSNKD